MDEVVADEVFTYTLNVTNHDTEMTIPAGLIVRDDIDLDLLTWIGNVRGTIIVPDAGGTLILDSVPHVITMDGELSVTLPILAPGTVMNIMFDVRARVDAVGETVLNTAFLQGGTGGIGEDNIYSEEIEVDIIGEPDLVTTKSVEDADGNGYAAPGGVLNYTITIENTGNATARGTFVRDNMAEMIDYIYAPGALATFTLDNDGTVTTLPMSSLMTGFTIPEIAAGATVTITFSVTVRNDLPEGVTELRNKVVVNDNGSSTTIVTGRSGVAVTKTASATTVAVGDAITYTITVENTGNVAFAGLVVTDTLPTGLVNQRNLNLPTGVLGGFSGNTLTATIANLAVGATVEITFVATVAADMYGETITNTAIVRDSDGDELDRDGEDVEVEEPTGQPAVEITKTASNQPPTGQSAIEVRKTVSNPTPAPGSQVTYTIRVTNNGDATLRNFFAQVVLPAGLTNPQNLTHGLASSSIVTATIVEPVAVGAYVEISFDVTVSGSVGQGIVSTAIVRDGATELGRGSVTVTPTLGSSAASVSFVEPQPASTTTAAVGDDITYTITVENTGNVVLTGLVVTDTLPTGLVNPRDLRLPTGVTGGFSGNTLTATIANLAVGATVEITFMATVAPDTYGETITNTAIVRDSDGEELDHDGEDVDVEDEESNLGVEITKSTAATVVAGNNLTYTITVENTGNMALTGLVVTDTLPTQLQNPRSLVLPTGATGAFNGRVLTVTLGALAPSDTVTITFVATVAAGTAAGTGIRNSANVTDPNNPDVGDDDSVLTSVRPPGTPGEDPWRQAFLIGDTVPAGQQRPIRPQGDITRAEVATIFFRLIEDDVRAHYWTQTNPFSDVTIDRWFNNAISTTHNMGLWGWIGENTFAPDRAITRGELAAVLVRFMNRDQIGPFSADHAEPLSGDEFHDIANHWARAYINVAARNGWVHGDSVNGVPSGNFRPGDTITRAETAAMINRIFQRLVESPDSLLDNMVVWHDNSRQQAWYYLYIQIATNSFSYTWGDNGYMDLIEIIRPRDWSVLERPFSRPEHILGTPSI